MPAAAGSVETVFIASDAAAWTASCDQPWLSVSPASGAFHEQVVVTAQANNSGTERAATVSISGSGAAVRAFTVTQAGADAAPAEVRITSPVEGSTVAMTVTVAGPWILTHEGDPWFDCEPSMGTGRTTVTIRAQSNPRTAERVAHIQLESGTGHRQRIAIRQDGESSYLSLSASRVELTGALNAPAVEFDGVLVRSNVAWSAATTASWLALSAKGERSERGRGQGRIWFHTVEKNPEASPRLASVTITADRLAPQTITVVQPGTAPFLAAMPAAVAINRGDAATFVVASNQPSWAAASDQPWLSTTKAQMPNRIILKAKPNDTQSVRTALITLTAGDAAPVHVTVRQSPSGRYLAVDPGVTRLGVAAGSESTVLVDADEGWTVTAVSAPWLAADAGIPVANAMLAPLSRESVPMLIPLTERRLRQLCLRSREANATGSERLAQVVITSASGATAVLMVSQDSGQIRQ